MIRIGLAQIDMAWEAIEENKRKVEDFIKKAKKEEVDVIVFPEMTMTGFSMNTSMAAFYEDQTLFFAKKAKEYRMAIVYGIIAPGRGDRFENHLIMADEYGSKILEYAKIHPFSYGAESRYYTGGDKVYACRWKEAVFSGFICYDLRFPSVFRLASRESQVIFVIANWPQERIDHWDILLRARAIENACYVVGVNRTGRAGKLSYNGHSAIYNYQGEALSEIREEEGLIVVRIDPDGVFKYRDYFPVLEDSRPDLYRNMSLQFYPGT